MENSLHNPRYWVDVNLWLTPTGFLLSVTVLRGESVWSFVFQQEKCQAASRRTSNQHLVPYIPTTDEPFSRRRISLHPEHFRGSSSSWTPSQNGPIGSRCPAVTVTWRKSLTKYWAVLFSRTSVRFRNYSGSWHLWTLDGTISSLMGLKQFYV